MRNFIISEDLLSAVAQCIGAATHGVPYGHVAALIRRLETLPLESPGVPTASEAGAEAPVAPFNRASRRRGRDKGRGGEIPASAPGAEASEAA